MNPVLIEIIQLSGKHANLGAFCVWAFYSESLANWTMSVD